MTNWVVRNSDGEFMVKGNGDPSLIHTQPSNYTLVSVAGNACPDPCTQKWNGNAVVSKTATEIANVDAQRKNIETREQLRPLINHVLRAILTELPQIVSQINGGIYDAGIFEDRIARKVEQA